MADDLHAPHVKHLQLGVDPDAREGDDDRHFVIDPDEVWADATTVEQFKADIEELARGARD